MELSKSLIEAGNKLLRPHSSTGEILSLLDELEYLLSKVEQDPTESVQKALIPSSKALVSAHLLRNPDSDVRVFVVSCLTEIMRITAPDAPYADDQMKEIFQVTIEAFAKLADASSRSYSKAEAVLDTVSRVRSSLLMLDLECDDLILDMFQLFLQIIRPDHPHLVLLAMETIMTTVIDESEQVSTDLLHLLLASVKKDTQDVTPMASKLVENVLRKCTSKLQPCLMEALKSTGISLDMYSPLVLSIFQTESTTTQAHNAFNAKENEADEKKSEEQVVLSDSLEDNLGFGLSRKGNRSKRTARGGTRRANGDDEAINGNDLKQLVKQGEPESTDAETESVSTRKRGRKPNSLLNPEEGYSFKTSSRKKMQEKEPGDLSLGKLAAKKVSLPANVGQTNQSVVSSLPSSSRAKKGSRKRSRNTMEETVAKKDSPDEEDFMESDLEKSEDGIKTAKSSKKARTQNGEAKTSAKKPLAETKMVKTSEKKLVHSDAKKKNSEGASKSTKMVKASEKKLAHSDVKKKISEGASKGTKMIKNNEKKFHSDAKKKNSKGASKGTPTPQSSKNKKKKSRATTPSTKESEETPKSHPKRKRTVGEEVESNKNELGEELVGKRVNVWWPLDKNFYEGVVQSYCTREKTHKVSYPDGDVEDLSLKKERWVIIEDNSSAIEDKEIDLPDSTPLVDLIRRRKAKKSKSVSMNVELSSSLEVRSSVKKKDPVTNSSKQAKRSKGGLKAVSNEPEGREAKNLESSKELNAEVGRTRGRTEKRQKVTRAMHQESEKDCDEKEEHETKGEDRLKESNAELECKRDHQDLPEDLHAATKTGGEELQSTKEPNAEAEINGEERMSVKDSNVEPKTDGEEWKAAKDSVAESNKVGEEPTAEPINEESKVVKELTDGEECKSVKETNTEPKSDEDEQKSLKEANAEPGADVEERKSVKEPNADAETEAQESAKEPNAEHETEVQEQESAKEPTAEHETEAQEQESAKEPTADAKWTEKEDMSEEKTSTPETGKVEKEAEEDDQRVVKELEEESDKAEVGTILGSG
ncbi:hypothetical protein AALP_AA1G179500 [Arabis alpina]|uniref:Tudor domain-containing protein n=1 Tax=Arabis alpina TaxID=50452 RepID=A0A087HNY2_ARAAL|nr:hypothetical protein AALP_AA1G179500 [Arabis alpina]